MGTVVSQTDLSNFVSQVNPALADEFVKDRPVAMWKITADNYQDIPEPIKTALGSVDQATYEVDGSFEKFMESRVGGAVVLQMNGDETDFYPISSDVFEGKYSVVEMDEVQTKNKNLYVGLQEVLITLKSIPDIVGALKTIPVTMFRASDVGFSVDEGLEIEAPWGGTQTKPEGQDAYLVPDGDSFYMVNIDESGMPIGYC